MITKPTRATSTPATLIDHILTNDLDDNTMHIQGILCTSISDHYAIFHIVSNAKTDHTQTEMPLVKRNMGQRNISKFISETNRVDWQFVLTENDTDLKKTWQVIKAVINKRKYTPINTKFKVNGATTNDGNVIANKLNKFFVNVGTVLAKSIPPTDKDPVDCLQQDIITNLYFDPTTENNISKIIGSLKDGASGCDDLK